MAKDGKFGTFGGVYTPSLLTILGVIMYLRLPWIVGNAGLVASLAIILVAHLVSVTTGLSVSSIATDKRVGAGGPYYIVSRSLGLPIGGTLGIALFLGLSISIAFYIIGFCESFLAYVGIEPTKNAIRIAGTLTIAGLTVITFVSTAFAIKTQYLILGFIVLSIGAIFLGSPEAPAAPALEPREDAPSMGLLFGIFFPAVTGFTAGVNMSGDLRDPKKAIPRGTMAAILTGLVVYIALAIYLSYRIPTDQLVGDPEVLLKVSFFPPFVLAGIWGATLSSALGCILGAPRVLQAMSGDQITPRFFFKGTGASNEPRRALLLAFVIGEAGILLAELNAIAGLVSMVFLALYGFLNLSCWIESWASPDFRPAFRIPRFVSLVGAIAAVLLMVQIDLAATFAAVTLMTGLFIYLQRKQLRLESGDTWRGVWSALVRSGLHRLSRGETERRNWTPNVLLFRTGDEPAEVAQLARSLATRTGMVTDCELVDEAGFPDDQARVDALVSADAEPRETGDAKPAPAAEEDERVGVFSRRIECRHPLETAAALCRFHGFTGLEPNTVMLSWQARGEDPDGFGRILEAVEELDLNLLLHARTAQATPRSDKKQARRIDVWWRDGVGNVPLSVALLRFITSELAWRGTAVRFLLWSEESANNDNLRTTCRGVLEDSRVDAAVRVVNDTRGFAARVLEESANADLVLLGLPDAVGTMDPGFADEADHVARTLPQVLFLRASSFFPEALTVVRRAKISSLPPLLDGGVRPELPTVPTPEAPALAGAVSGFAERTLTAAVQFHDHCIAPVYGEQVRLVRRLEQLARRELGALDSEGELGGEALRKLLDEAQRAIGEGAAEELGASLDEKLAAQRSSFAGRIETLVEQARKLSHEAAVRLRVERAAADFAPGPDDSPLVRRIKRRRRFAARFSRGRVRYEVPSGRLEAHHFDRLLRDLVRSHVDQVTLDARQLAVQLGKVVGSFRTRIGLLLAEGHTGAALRDRVGEELDQLGERLGALSDLQKTRVRELQWASMVKARQAAIGYAEDVERVDSDAHARRERPLAKDLADFAARLLADVERWSEEQRGLLERAQLAVSLSTFQHRLASSAHRLKEAISTQIETGSLRACRELREGLESVRSHPDDRALRARLTSYVELEASFDGRPAVEALLAEMASVTQALPESQQILSDASVRALEERSGAELEHVDMPVRRLAQFLVESELVGGLQEALAEAPRVEQKTVGVARDVARLLSMQDGEGDELEDDDAAPLARQVSAAATSSIARLDEELVELEALLGRLNAAVDQHLRAVVDATSPYDLSSAWAKVSQQARVLSGRKAVSGAQSALVRLGQEVRAGLVQLLYRRSAGVVLARRLRTSASSDAGAGSILALIDRSSPSPDVVTSLPSYYRQLFLGQSTINETFWVGRERELAQAEDAVGYHRRGTPGAVLVVGDRGMGKSALCQRIVTRFTDGSPVYFVQAPPGGSSDPAELRAALAKAVGAEGNPGRLLRGTPLGSVFVLDDLELWWERRDGGEAALDGILDLVARYGDKRLFVLGIGRQAYKLLGRIRPIADHAVVTIECDALSAEALESVITLRHGSSGLAYRLADRREERLTPWQTARLFSGHFDYSGGNVGAALRSWLTHVSEVEDRTLVVRIPERPRWASLDDLRPEQVALLIQLVLHKQAAFERLARVTGLEHADLRRELEPLRRMGLVVRGRQRTFGLNPFVQHVVTERFERRGLLA